MNLQIITLVKSFIKKTLILSVGFVCLIVFSTSGAWEVDLTKRQKELVKRGLASDSPTEQPRSPDLIEKIFSESGQSEDIVVMNTDKGFVPKTLRLREGQQYTIHVVNVSETNKNVSFVLDAFSEHHATYYGKIKSFRVHPKKEGIFSFQCPETSFEGRVVVYPGAQLRVPASQIGE